MPVAVGKQPTAGKKWCSSMETNSPLCRTVVFLCRVATSVCCLVATMGVGCRGNDRANSLPGTAGAPCVSSQDCETPLLCDVGYCVPLSCQRGTNSCACHVDGTCDPIGISPMSCRANICRPSEEPPDGEYGAACSADLPCHGVTRGNDLDCIDGRCEQPGCPAGVVGCGCGPYGWCDPFEEQPVRCNLAERCALGGCVPGTVGCACGAGCDTGLACTYGVCRRRSHRVEISVDNPLVRACDLVVRQGPDSRRDRPVRPVFATGVLGESVQRLPKIALSFIRRQNQAFDGAVARLETDHEVTQPGAYSVSKVSCYDHLGLPVATPAIRLSN